MFKLDRTFSQYSAKTGLTEWYFNAREGIYGPYPSKQKAAEELLEFIELQMRSNDDGGRSKGDTKSEKLSVLLTDTDIGYKKKKNDDGIQSEEEVKLDELSLVPLGTEISHKKKKNDGKLNKEEEAKLEKLSLVPLDTDWL